MFTPQERHIQKDEAPGSDRLSPWLRTRNRWLSKGLWGLCVLLALLPALWLLNHPMPVAWLRPLCKDTYSVLLACGAAAALPLLWRQKGMSAWSLAVISVVQAVFQAWCYNTGSHPAGNELQIWGILPSTDSQLYFTTASQLLDGQRIAVMFGSRHPFPVLFALLLKICDYDFRLVTLILTLLMTFATWSAFEAVRLRLGGVAAIAFLACVTMYIRSHCAGLFVSEQLGFLYGLCATALLIESTARQGKAKAWLYCGGLFFLTQALNARPAAYLTLPFLVLASWPLCYNSGVPRGRMFILSSLAVIASLVLHVVTYREVVTVRVPSNAWYCIYGELKGATWTDGVKRAMQLFKERTGGSTPDWEKSIRIEQLVMRDLRNECLSEIKRHPAKLIKSWRRGLAFLWFKNTLFRADSAEMPAAWFTESARWCTILGALLSLFFLLKAQQLPAKLTLYSRISWLNMAALFGLLMSLPFAPPSAGETRIYAATLPLLFLLPATGAGGLYLLLTTRRHRIEQEKQSPVSAGPPVLVAGVLSLAVALAPEFLLRIRSVPENRRHPARLLVEKLAQPTGAPSVFDLRLLQRGYHLHVADENQRTWLPVISKKDFDEHAPGERYFALRPAFKQVPPGSEVVVLPYWILLVLDSRDAQARTFTPRPSQTGRLVLPAVYFSKGLNISGL